MVSPTTVSVIGAGPIGAAVARALLSAGHRVTVWNRTVERTTGLASAGALVAESPAEAVRASDLTIVSLASMAVSAAVLTDPEVTEALRGRTVTQVTSATPDETLAEARWAEANGIGYLKGYMLTYPRGIGTDFGLIFMAGPLPTFQQHRPVLEEVAALQHVGEDLRRPSIFAACAVWLYYASVYGLLQASAYAESHDVAMDEVMNAGDGAVHRFLAEAFSDENRRIQTRAFSGEEAPISTHLQSLELVLDIPGMAAAGMDPGFAPALKELMERAVARGDGPQGIAALVEHIRA